MVSSDIELTLNRAGLGLGFEVLRLSDDWDICLFSKLLVVGTNFFSLASED